MGVLTPPGDDPSLASKPKEKQFQVVPVPAVFSRGRWKCCDFREAQLADNGMIEFVKPSKHPVDITQNASTIIVTNVAPNQLKALQKQQHLLEDEGKLPEPVMVAAPLIANNNLNGGSGEPTHFDFPPASAGATMTTQDATNLVNDLRVPEAAAAELQHSASSATINIPVTTAPTKVVDATDISAIDSKIEQAMDLVKSHVTFAVRQEVEELKTTITSLQKQVNQLESENHYLKRFAPPDILANLSSLIQNKMPYHKAESVVSEQQSSSRNLSPAPSELDEPPITIAAHHSLPPVSHSTRPALRIPAVSSVAMMMDQGAGAVPPTPPAANFPNMGIYEPGTPGLPRSASAIETTQIQSINENVQEDHTRQMTPPQQQQQQHPIHPSHSTSHMVRHQQQHQSYPQTPQTPQPLTYPQQPPMHSYMPIPQMMHQQQQPQQTVPGTTAFIRQMSPPMTIPMNPHDQRHFSPPVVMNQHEAAAAAYQQHQQQQQLQQQQQQQNYQQATNPFSPTSQPQPNIFQHYPSHPQQQQQQQQLIQQQQQNFQNIPVESQQQQQQMPVHPSQQQQHQQQYYHQQQQPQ